MLLTQKVSMGIIDSGVNRNSEKLRDLIVESVTVEPQKGDELTQESECNDRSGHGTSCAEIIASIAPEVDFYAVKVLNEKNQGYGSALISALEWMLSKKVQIINLSLGTTNDRYLKSLISLINQLNAQNTTVVSAAFWEAIYPAAIPSVISVADAPLFFSIPQERLPILKIDFVVIPPDSFVETFKLGGVSDNQSRFSSSFAAPYVTGVIGLIKRNYPELSLREIYKLILFCTEQGNLLDFQKNPFLREVLNTNSFDFDRLRSYKKF